jgi:hypothetical protein
VELGWLELHLHTTVFAGSSPVSPTSAGGTELCYRTGEKGGPMKLTINGVEVTVARCELHVAADDQESMDAFAARMERLADVLRPYDPETGPGARRLSVRRCDTQPPTAELIVEERRPGVSARSTGRVPQTKD